MPENQLNKCPNCYHVNSSGYKFCEECGQKNRSLKITFGEFVRDFFSLVFNLDNKFWKTFAYLFIPGKLTKIFFEGKRKSFYHPLRLYLVSVVVIFSILSILNLGGIIQMDDDSMSLSSNYQTKKALRDQKAVVLSTLDSLKSSYTSNIEKAVVDSVGNKLFFVYKNDTTYINQSSRKDSNKFKILSTTVNYTQDELFLEDIDQVVERKNINNFFERLFFKQFLKGARDLGSLNNFLFANLTWLFVGVIPIFALILKLFYIRRKRLYMEHFVFLLHLFTALIFIVSALLITFYMTGLHSIYITLVVLLFTLFPFFAFRFYYQQSFIKTLIKFVGIGVFFIVSFLLTLSIFLVVTAALF